MPSPSLNDVWRRARRGLRQRLTSGRGAVAGVPLLWLGLFFGLPFLIIARISLSEVVIGLPPYSALIEWAEDGLLQVRLNLANFMLLWQDSLYLDAFVNSIRVAAVSTLLCLLLGYPMALGITRVRASLRVPLLMLVILPFWTSFLIRVYAWIGILKGNGLINNLLLGLGLIDQPLQLLHTDFAVYLGIVYGYLPFMVLPLYATLSRMDDSLLEAAADLGCRPLCAFWRITLPLSIPGIVAGSLLVFVPAVGEFVIPDLLGGPDSLMVGKVLWTEFFNNRDWPVAAAIAVALLALLVAPVMLFERFREKGQEAS
ncbi:MAG: ABC transporter permease subunit [Chromatiaceae bacterium]|nr:ABC transporter permease subunit [Chromatiaceae bacterium]MCP5315452.1 ABC transporter permease subunit [Chromatiaceae bacterium]